MKKNEFPNLTNKEIGSDIEKLNKRKVEALALFSMIALYSKNQSGEKIKGDSLIDILPKFISEEVEINMRRYRNWRNMEVRNYDIGLLNRSLKRIENCPHIMYKSFCHRCPTNCFSEKDSELIKPVMDYSKIRVLFLCPITGFRFFKRIIESKLIIRKLKKDADF